MSGIKMTAAALEAGAKAIADINGWRDEQGLIACMPVARLCFLAIIEAWEGAQHDNYVIVLPLTEKTDD
jgi:hypothetical protein